jgi:hypothetical protein
MTLPITIPQIQVAKIFGVHPETFRRRKLRGDYGFLRYDGTPHREVVTDTIVRYWERIGVREPEEKLMEKLSEIKGGRP